MAVTRGYARPPTARRSVARTWRRSHCPASCGLPARRWAKALGGIVRRPRRVGRFRLGGRRRRCSLALVSLRAGASLQTVLLKSTPDELDEHVFERWLGFAK